MLPAGGAFRGDGQTFVGAEQHIQSQSNERQIERERERERERESERGGRQDCKIVIIAHTNEELITPQLAAQTVLLMLVCRGQHAASARLGGA